MNTSQQKLNFLDLQTVLDRMKFWLSSSYSPQIVLAAPTKEELESQKLPHHCKVFKRKLHGPRIPVVGKYQQEKKLHSKIAYWPEDAIIEGIRSIVIVVLKGNPKLNFADYSVLCRPGDFIVAPAQIPRFSAEKPPHEPITEHSHFDLALIFYGQPDPSRISMRICHFRNGEDEPAKEGQACWLNDAFMGQILLRLEAYLEKGNADNDCAASLLKSFSLLLQREIIDGNALNKLLPADSLHVIHQNPIKKATIYIQNHLDRPLSINLVARWVALSRSVFTRQFRAETGCSFTEYVSHLRMEQAKVLLLSTDLSIVLISKEVGLSTGRLRQLFHEKYQCTPRQFRKTKRKAQY